MKFCDIKKGEFYIVGKETSLKSNIVLVVSDMKELPNKYAYFDVVTPIGLDAKKLTYDKLTKAMARNVAPVPKSLKSYIKSIEEKIVPLHIARKL